MAIKCILQILFIIVFLINLILCEIKQNLNIVQIEDTEFNDIFPKLPIVVFDNDNTNQQCFDDSVTFVNSFNNYTTWAYEMWDASAKSAIGQAAGSTFNIGHFDECLQVNGPFRTKYCMVDVHLHFQPSKLMDKYSIKYDPNDIILNELYFKGDRSQYRRDIVTMGLCVPNSCTHKDLEKSLNIYLEKISNKSVLNITYTASILPQLCQNDRREETFDSYDIGFCVLIGVLTLLTLLGTILFYDYNPTLKSKSNVSAISKILRSFSVKQNFDNLFHSDENSNRLKHLYGMKVFCISFIIIDHLIGTAGSGMVKNVRYVEEFYRSLGGIFFFHGDVFVDTFFMISGLLVTYCLLVQFQKKFLNPALLVFLRYVRLTPLYAVTLFYYATLFYKSGSGPQWDLMVSAERDFCRESWWANLLYISNYVKADKMCMIHTWYLPCDMHYFIFAIFLVLLLHKNQTAGLFAICITTIISVIIPFTITYVYEHEALLHFYPEFLRDPRNNDVFRELYSKTHTRATSYLIGMIVGFILFKTRKSTHKLSQFSTICYFCASIIMMAIGMISGYIFYIPGLPYNALVAAMYAAFHRLIWAVGNSVFILTLGFGKMPIVSRLLTSNVLLPVSKLTYGCYLVHMIFLISAVASNTQLSTLTFSYTAIRAVSFIIASFAAALVGYLLVEAPMRGMTKEFLLPSKIKQEIQKKVENVEIYPKSVFTIKTTL